MVPLGGNAAKYFGLTGAISTIRGSVYEAHGFLVLPTFHPAYFAHMRYSKGDSTVDLKAIWVADLRKAKRIAEEGWIRPTEDFITHPTVQDLELFTRRAVQNKTLLAVDIEATGFDPFRSELVVVGLAESSSKAISVPFLKTGGQQYWSNGDQLRRNELLNQLFTSCPLMFQNALYDVPLLRGKGFKIPYENIAHDTMLLHHAISPELPHKLGFIVSVYGDTPYWKGEMLERIGSLIDEPDENVRPYNLRDAVVLHQVLPGLLEDLVETGTQDVYYKESLPLLAPIGAMIEKGVKLDEKKLAVYKRNLGKRLSDIDAKLHSSGKLPEVFNLSSGDDLRWFLYGVRPNKFDKITQLKEYEVETATKRPRKKDTKVYQDIKAIEEISQVRPFVSLASFHGRTTEGGAVSTDEQGLLSLQFHINNRLAALSGLIRRTEDHNVEEKGLKALLEWLTLFYTHRSTAKLLSTYTHYPTWQDGRVHTKYLIHGTSTGRLSSSQPNLQNLPKEEIEARSVFIPEDGYVFLSADYVNLEVWVLAYETQDELLLQQLKSGLNIHDENTKILFGLQPGDPKWKLARKAAKIFQFGSIQYAGSDKEIYAKVVLAAPDFGLTLAQYVQAHNTWNRAHPGYAAWARTVQAHALQHREVSTAFGRKRILYGAERDIVKQALNTPIQGGAAGVVNVATIGIHKRLAGMRSGLVLQIHDELVVEAHRDELALVRKIVREEMERPVNWRGQMVTFKTDQKVGLNWAQCYSGE